MKYDQRRQVAALFFGYRELGRNIHDPLPEYRVEKDLTERRDVERNETEPPTQNQTDHDQNTDEQIDDIQGLLLERS